MGDVHKLLLESLEADSYAATVDILDAIAQSNASFSDIIAALDRIREAAAAELRGLT